MSLAVAGSEGVSENSPYLRLHHPRQLEQNVAHLVHLTPLARRVRPDPRDRLHQAWRAVHQRRRKRRWWWRLVALQQALDFFLQSNARWYSLHGVDLLRPRYQRSPLNHLEDTNAFC